jgi:hypothetical protein
MIRGVFVEDPSIKRDQIINQILNEDIWKDDKKNPLD